MKHNISRYMTLLSILGIMLISGAWPVYSQIPNDPLSCEGLSTFEDLAEFLRNVYVATTGSDATGDGTAHNPYRTLQYALQQAKPGDIIHVAAGIYSTKVYLENVQGTAEHPIKIAGSESGETVLTGDPEGIHFVDASYVIMQDMIIDGANDNGINIDDGGSYETPSEYIILRRLTIRNIGSGGNNDGLKLSGVNHVYILDNIFSGGSLAGGSGIDMVGCHNGLVLNNRIEQFGSNFVQTKGGSEEITIHGNIFRDTYGRGIQMGGSTSVPYFRPSIENGTNFEARHIRATNNVIMNAETGIAYTGCVECLAAHNVIYQPYRWVLRILQETTWLNGVSFLPSSHGQFLNNIIVFPGSINAFTNVGKHTAPTTFRFANNLWYCSNDPDFNYTDDRALLPTHEENPIQQFDPLFRNEVEEDFHLSAQSPAIDQAETKWVNTDADGICNINDIGAFEHQDPIPASPETPEMVLLTIQKIGDGSGLVLGENIDCGENCTQHFPVGTTVALSSYSDLHSEFVGWFGACAGSGECRISLTEDTIATASFRKLQQPTPIPIMTPPPKIPTVPTTVVPEPGTIGLLGLGFLGLLGGLTFKRKK